MRNKTSHLMISKQQKYRINDLREFMDAYKILQSKILQQTLYCKHLINITLYLNTKILKPLQINLFFLYYVKFLRHQIQNNHIHPLKIKNWRISKITTTKKYERDPKLCLISHIHFKIYL